MKVNIYLVGDDGNGTVDLYKVWDTDEVLDIHINLLASNVVISLESAPTAIKESE